MENANAIESVSSLANRPFQEAKVNSRIICLECFGDNGEIKFFLEDAGLTQHFRVKHRHLVLDNCMTKHCRMLFQDLHGQETVKTTKDGKNFLTYFVSWCYCINFLCVYNRMNSYIIE